MNMEPISQVSIENLLRNLINKPGKFQVYCQGETSLEKFFKEAIKQSYLKKITETIDETKTNYYEWGVRSILEIKRLDVLSFVSKVFIKQFL